MLDNKQWDVFQTSTGLRGDSYGRGGCVELTNAQIKHAALFERGRLTTQQYPSWMCLGLAELRVVNPHLQTQQSTMVRSHRE